MAEDIVAIGLKVDSTSVKAGTRALDDLGNQADETAKSTDVLARSLKAGAIAASAMAAAGLAFAIVKTTQFNKSMSELSAITGAVGKDLEFLRKKSLEFGSTTTKSASEVATAFKLVASAKPDLLANAAALSVVTRQVITLAEASGTDLANAADTVGASLNQFGAEADQAARFVNVLAAGSKFGSSAVNETSLALKNAGTVAAGAGLSFEEANAAIQALAKVAIKGGEAGTGLRGVLLKLSTQTNDDFNPKIVGFTQSIKNLRDAELSDIEMKKLFGQESITSANALIQEADSLDELTMSLTDTNTAMEQARINTDNLDGDMKSLMSAVEGVSISLGENLDPWLRSITQASTEAAQGLNIFLNVLTDADDQMALAVQISAASEALAKLKEEVATAQEEGVSFAGIFFAGEDISITGPEKIAQMEEALQELISRRNEIISEDAGMVSAAEAQRAAERIDLAAETEDKLLVVKKKASKEEERLAKRAATNLASIESQKVAQVFGIAQSLVPMITKNAKEQALITAALSAAEVFMNYQVAVSKTFATLGPAGAPVAAALEGKMFLSMGAIAAKAAISLSAPSTSGGSGGGIPIGGGRPPAKENGGTTAIAAPVAEERASNINISLEGDNQSTASVRKLIEAINEEVGNGVTLRVQ